VDRAHPYDAPVLVVCAVARELAELAPREGVEIVAVGVGPVEAALGTARALAHRSYRAVINAGIAGGFRDRCAVGDVVVVTREEYVELGLEDGSAFSLPDGAALERVVEADSGLIAPFVGGIAPVILGRGVTSATVTSTHARARLLALRYRADVESMEGFAVLRAAREAGVPAIEIRGVSNLVGDRASNEWDFAAGARGAVETTGTLLDVLFSR
jgi:futalosine hydrolase